MKNTIRQVFHSSKFVVGFVIFVAILLTLFIYPLINPGNPLEMIGVGTFARPGTYFSLYDAVKTPTETLRLANADDKRLGKQLSDEDRVAIVAWLSAVNVNVEGLDISDTETLLEQWRANYDPSVKPKGMTQAKRNYYKRLDAALKEVNAADTLIIADKNEDGQLEQQGTITKTDYVNVGQVANVKKLPLGTDNFGRDVLKELVSAAGTSIVIGLLAGLVATLIMFFTNIFTVIPGFVLLILISYSIGQEQRGAAVVALVIGLTSWTWTCRSVRSQVISLRNRDHVNLSKLSGHSLVRIILTDILPYIASYVVMAFILQVSSGILAEAQLSLLGLGPKTTEVPTLGLMMNWAMLYSAHTNGSWWAYFPVILTITLISFSLNLMNTGLDQVFNPTLRD